MRLLSISLFLLFTFIISSPACAAKGGPAKRSGSEKTEVLETMTSTSELEDIVQGLTDFEKRVSQYNADEWNFVLGYAHYRHGRWREALEYLSKTKLPQIADHILFYRAVAANREGKADEALALLDELKAGYPDSVWERNARLERGRNLIALNRFREARATLAEYRQRADTEGAFDANILTVQAMIGEGDAGGAENLVRNLAVSADGEARLNKLSGLMDELEKRFKSDIRIWLSEPTQQMRLAEAFAASSQWDEVVAKIERLLGHKGLGASFETQAKWLLARSYRWIHRYDESIHLMEDLMGDPSSVGFSESLANALATTYTKKNDYAKAIALRRKMAEHASKNSSAAMQMAYKVAFLYMDEGKYEEAIPLWKTALSMRGGEKREQAEWYLGWSYFMAGKYDGALAVFDGMLKGRMRRLPMHDRLLYWKGRVLEKMGRVTEAREVYGIVRREHPDGYYSELAGRRIKGDIRSVANFARVSNPSRATSSARLKGRIDIDNGPSHIAKAALFDRLGLHEEAARELRVVGPGCDTNELLTLAARNFAHDLAYRIAEGSYHGLVQGMPPADGTSSAIWQAAYPRAYDPLVTRLLRGSEVDPRLVWSIMRNESTFRPEVTSPAGAVGLMQLMPATANRLASGVGRQKIERRDLTDPATNVALGVTYMKKLALLFPHNPAALIASYNAGEEAVDRWIKNGKEEDIEEWIEEIPYDETNLYVKKVMLSYWKYQRLYGN